MVRSSFETRRRVLTKVFFDFRLNMKYLEQNTEFREILVLRLKLAVHFVTLINPSIRPLHFSLYFIKLLLKKLPPKNIEEDNYC
jgi:hypothetical protein